MGRRYVISDLHLGHGNIIEYCNRPFDDVDDMNESLVKNWNEMVQEDDAVLMVGDVCHHPTSLTSIEWLNKLNGNIMVVRGNHDGDLPQNSPYNVVDSCTIRHGRYPFYVSHEPLGYDGWEIHGHVHDNNLHDYPFINHDNRTVNVSVEVINYRPLLMDKLISLIERGESIMTINESIDK